ncbi:MAG: hypothetical protein HN368_23490 [Spirochaetales bacterium]|nr:hypothetical protein [Spirochaetales bacterium]
MENGRNVVTFLSKTLGIKQQLNSFHDIRTNPTISLRTILWSVFLMPFFGLKSLLAMDALARTRSYRRLFDCKRKMVVSDSTVARILTWLMPAQSKQLLYDLAARIDRLGLLDKALEPGGTPRRIGIIDGSVMGGHHHVTFSLHGRIDCPVVIEDQHRRGKELPVALDVIDEAYKHLGSCFPDLILCDSLYFNGNMFRKVRGAGAHILIKSSNPEFRAVLQEAQFLFEHDVVEGVETDSGYDSERLWHWSMKKTSGEFAGYPIQIAHLVENYSKRTTDALAESWIVSTDFSLSSLSLREAAHLRWHIENNVFKRISHLAGTKRFYFKDPRRFYSMLRFFCAALAAFDAYISMVRHSPREFKLLLDGIKPTWKNIFSRLQDQLEDVAFG